MSDPTTPRRPVTRLLAPSPRWSGHVRAYVVRDTRGCDQSPAARQNRFPASPYCTLTWFLEGGATLLSCGGQAVRVELDGCVAAGCQTTPFASENRGETHAFLAAFHADAFHAVFGVDLSRLQDRFVPAGQVLPPHALAMVAAVAAAAADEQRRAIIESFLAEHAPPAPSGPWYSLRRLGDRITLAVASAMIGVGPRQLQRLAPRQAGASLQTLLRLWRGERSFLRAQRLLSEGRRLDLADHAIAAGYADQAHLTRETRTNTGRTPAQLVREAATEEADWIYRIDFNSHEDTPPSRSA